MAEEILMPKKLPDEHHAVIVVLDSTQIQPPKSIDTSPMTHEVLIYKRTSVTDVNEVAERVQNASVVVSTMHPVTRDVIRNAAYLKAVLCHTTGVDHIDLEACEESGIKVYNSSGTAIEAVSEHALMLYFATRRALIPIQAAMMDFDKDRPNSWKREGSVVRLTLDANRNSPNTCAQETVGMIGYGLIGRRIAALCRALGMKVIIADRKKGASNFTSNSLHPNGKPPRALPAGEVRTPFKEVLRTATVLMIAVPLVSETRNLISAAELATMRPETVIVNVSRGGLVDEAALAQALAKRKVFGYGTDVFDVEPAGSGDDCPLLSEGARGLNVAMTPHVAWSSTTTRSNVTRLVYENVRHWVDGSDVNRVV